MRASTQITAMAEERGWRFYRKGKKHDIYVCPCGECRPQPIPGSTGDVRMVRNMQAKFDRCPKARCVSGR